MNTSYLKGMRVCKFCGKGLNAENSYHRQPDCVDCAKDRLVLLHFRDKVARMGYALAEKCLAREEHLLAIKRRYLKEKGEAK